jgi:hypothetical protein
MAFVSVLKWVVRAVFGISSPTRSGPVMVSVQCSRPRCHANNPGHARYCRRCGQPVIEQFTLRAA